MSTPISLISLSNELNGLIDIFERVFALGAKGANRLRRRSAGKAAETLHGLHFSPTGIRGPLENIASGKGCDTDFEALNFFIRETFLPVEKAIQRLRPYLDVVRKQCGAGVCTKLEELLGGPYGKFKIREKIRFLRDYQGDSDLQNRAKEILEMIDAFNNDVNEIHDMIFPPTGAPR